MNKKVQKVQSRTWGLILPCEWENHMNIVHKTKSVAKYYYWIRHDRDYYTEPDDDAENPHAVGELKKPHIHLLFTFNSSRDLKTVQNYFSEFKELKENSFEKIANAYGAKRYLIHADNPEKYQYDKYEVETNDKIFTNVFVEKISSDLEIEIIKKSLGAMIPLTFSEFIDLFTPLLVNMNTYQKSMFTMSLLKEWRYRQGVDRMNDERTLKKIGYM